MWMHACLLSIPPCTMASSPWVSPLSVSQTLSWSVILHQWLVVCGRGTRGQTRPILQSCTGLLSYRVQLWLSLCHSRWEWMRPVDVWMNQFEVWPFCVGVRVVGGESLLGQWGSCVDGRDGLVRQALHRLSCACHLHWILCLYISLHHFHQS